jgi:hypothetical protein
MRGLRLLEGEPKLGLKHEEEEGLDKMTATTADGKLTADCGLLDSALAPWPKWTIDSGARERRALERSEPPEEGPAM